MSEDYSIITGNKRMDELDQINKLTGTELMLIDNGDLSMKVTVDTLLGYIAREINAGTIHDGMFSSCNIIEMDIDEDIPVQSRVDGNKYLKTCRTYEAQIAAGIDTTIVVSPNMGLRIVED